MKTNTDKSSNDDNSPNEILPMRLWSAEEIQELDEFMQSDDFQKIMRDGNLTNDVPTTGLIADINQTFPINDSQVNERQVLLQQSLRSQKSAKPSQPSATVNTQDMIPDQSMGPSYDPRLGWYFPAVPVNGMSAPHGPFFPNARGYAPLNSMPANNVPAPRASYLPVAEGYIPMSSESELEVSSTGTTTPQPPVVQRQLQSKSKARPKYGPAVYLAEQAKKKLAESEESIPPGKPVSKHLLRIPSNPPVVQACVCSDKEKNKIKRPKNAFILYRSANSQVFLSRNPNMNNADVSRVMGYNWKHESSQVREKYFELAKKEKARHAAEHPNYQYRPGTSNRNKFGSASCSCGAFQANIAVLVANPSYQDLTSDSESEKHEEPYKLSNHAPLQLPSALADRMTMKEATSVPSGSDSMSLVRKGELIPYLNEHKRKREAATIVDEGTESEPLPKRRSSRLNKKSVSYAEPSEDDIYSYQQLEQDSTGSINPARLTLQTMTASPTMHSDLGTPARKTRRNSLRGKAASPHFAFDFDLNFDFDENPNWDSNWNDAFSDLTATAQADTDGDNIVVAQHRLSPKGGSWDVRRSPAMSTRSRSKSIEVASPTNRNSQRRSSRSANK